MFNLRNSLLLTVVTFLVGCQTIKVFDIKTYPDGGMDDLQVVNVNTDRIRHQCYFMNAEAENNWRHQYVMYILNDKNEVLWAMYPTNQGDEECLSHLNKVDKVLKKELIVKMCLRGEYKKDDGLIEWHDFGKLGKHKSTHESFYFDSICNSKECYSINETWTTTCPGFVKHERSENQ